MAAAAVDTSLAATSAATATCRHRRRFLFAAASVLWFFRGHLTFPLTPPASAVEDAQASRRGGGGDGPAARHATREWSRQAGGRRGAGGVGGFRVVRDATPRADLRRCFAPLYGGAEAPRARWEATRLAAGANVTCDLRGIGAFRIARCAKDDICFAESLDADDRGARYFVKLGKPPTLRGEAEVVRHLSDAERSRDLTAKSHPRYPYLQWQMSDDRDEDVAVAITEELRFENFRKVFRGSDTVEGVLSDDTVRCWEDVMSVMKALWEFRGGYYIHNDVHRGQILPVRDETGTLRCRVIDFGMVLSLNQTRRGGRHHWTNPFWYAALRDEARRAAYVRERGAAAFRRRGWEFSVVHWGEQVFLRRLVAAARGVDPFPDREDDEAAVVAKWCRVAEVVRELAGALAESRPGAGRDAGPLVSDAAVRMVVEQATIIEGGVAAAMDCRGAVVPETPCPECGMKAKKSGSRPKPRRRKERGAKAGAAKAARDGGSSEPSVET